MPLPRRARCLGYYNNFLWERFQFCVFRALHPPSAIVGGPRRDHGLAKGEHNAMTYTAEIRRVGGSLYKAARGSSNLFLPDTCFSNTVRPVWA